MERLQKYISRCGVTSRRKAEELITAGRVKVNGVVVTELGTKVTGNDVVMVDDEIIEIDDFVYLLMNKPAGVVSTTSDEKDRKTVVSILPPEYQKYHIYPVGRLDYDTKGVLLLTNNGEFMNTIIGPKSCVEKEYLARVEGVFTKEDLRVITGGIKLDGYKTRKCKGYIKSVDYKNNSSLVGLIIKEGKNHQVKNMFDYVNHPVKKLNRIRFGELTTEGVKEGTVRSLTPHEIKRLYVLSKGCEK